MINEEITNKTLSIAVTVAIAAPINENFGIKIKFKMILNTATIA